MSNDERVIKVFSTQGAQKVVVNSSAITWGELKEELSGVDEDGNDYNYNFESLQASENINRTDLISLDAVLPTCTFVIFLRPVKTKAGLDVEDYTFSQMRDLVKENRDDEAFMEHINSDGNYTRLPTEMLRDKLSSWSTPNDEEDYSFEEMSTEKKIEVVKELTETINEEGNYIITLEIKEGCAEDCQETKALEEEAKDILVGYEN